MKKTNFCFGLLLMFILSATTGWGQGTDTVKHYNPAVDQASPAAAPGDRRLLEDTGGKSGLRGKSDTGHSINEQSTSQPVKDMRANDKYFSIGAALLISLVVIAIVVRSRRRS